jgi:peptidylprolyl isomerase
MTKLFRSALIAAAVLAAAAPAMSQTKPAPLPTPASILAASPKTDWRAVDPANTLYMDLPTGRVVIELNPAFAPKHVANIKLLVRQGFFDGLAVVRLQDGFVAQWGDPDAEEEGKARAYGRAAKTLKGEFVRPNLKDLEFTPWPDRDTYADAVGFVNGMPAARDPKTGQAWLTHCTGTVAVGRDTSPDSGSGGELYTVIGQPARRLDKNLTVVGRILEGYPLLAKLKPGPGAMGFYMPDERTPIVKVRVASDLPATEQKPLEALRTDSRTFKAIVDLKKFQKTDFYQTPVGAMQLCDAPLEVRPAKP